VPVTKNGMMEKQFCAVSSSSRVAPKRKNYKGKQAGSDIEEEGDDSSGDFVPDGVKGGSGQKGKAAVGGKGGKDGAKQEAEREKAAELQDGTDKLVDEPKWMAKYQNHDLKVTKGDLDGLTPYLVVQILSVTLSTKGSRGVVPCWTARVGCLPIVVISSVLPVLVPSLFPLLSGDTGML
jgi:hypothetical protein